MFDVAAYVEVVSGAIGLPLEAEAKRLVAAQLQIAAGMAAEIMEFPLPPEEEAAPVFTP